MYSRINYTIVGLFVLLFSIGAVAFTLWLGKYDTNSGYKTYKIYFRESVNGLSKDSTVKYKGVDIGRVKSIRIDPKDIGRVEVIVNIRDDVPITEDMRAHLELIGVTGLVNVVLDGGSKNSKPLISKDGKIPVIKSIPSWLNRAKSDIAKVNENIQKTLIQIQKLLSDENIQTASNFLKNLNISAVRFKSLEQNSTIAIKKLQDAIDSFKIALDNFNKNFSSATNSVNRVSDELIPTIKDFKKTVNNFNRVTLKINSGLKRGDYNLRRIFEPLMNDTRVLTTQLNILIEHLQDSPNDIIFKSRRDKKGPGE